jgi:hypothetical protein
LQATLKPGSKFLLSKMDLIYSNFYQGPYQNLLIKFKRSLSSNFWSSPNFVSFCLAHEQILWLCMNIAVTYNITVNLSIAKNFQGTQKPFSAKPFCKHYTWRAVAGRDKRTSLSHSGINLHRKKVYNGVKRIYNTGPRKF